MRNFRLLLITIICLAILSVVGRLDAQELSERRKFIQGNEDATLIPEGVEQARARQTYEQARKELREERIAERDKEYDRLLGKTDLGSSVLEQSKVSGSAVTENKDLSNAGAGDAGTVIQPPDENDGTPTTEIVPPEPKPKPISVPLGLQDDE